jgi:signal transduction histidine kinase
MPNAIELVPRLFEAVSVLASLVLDGRQGVNAEQRALVDEKSGQLRLAVHELRRPLSVMGGHLSMVLTGDFGTVPDSMLHSLHTMKGSMGEMQGLVDMLAEAARLEDRAQALHKEPTPIGYLVRDAIRAVEEPAQNRGVVVGLDVSEPDLVASVDRRRFRIAILNLVLNAIKFSEEGSKVTVKVRSGPSSLAISVTDQGPGIAPSERELIFEAWRRSTQASAPGLGLGLSIARDIVQMHGGRLVLESQPGEGATFRIVLPLSPTPLSPLGGRP